MVKYMRSANRIQTYSPKTGLICPPACWISPDRRRVTEQKTSVSSPVSEPKTGVVPNHSAQLKIGFGLVWRETVRETAHSWGISIL